MITQDVANEIRTGTRGYFFDGSRDTSHSFFPVIQMLVTWTPHAAPVDPVPDPPSVVLTALGGALIVARRLRNGFSSRSI
jgi:hypothetical protein